MISEVRYFVVIKEVVHRKYPAPSVSSQNRQPSILLFFVLFLRFLTSPNRHTSARARTHTHTHTHTHIHTHSYTHTHTHTHTHTYTHTYTYTHTVYNYISLQSTLYHKISAVKMKQLYAKGNKELLLQGTRNLVAQ